MTLVATENSVAGFSSDKRDTDDTQAGHARPVGAAGSEAMAGEDKTSGGEPEVRKIRGACCYGVVSTAWDWTETKS